MMHLSLDSASVLIGISTHNRAEELKKALNSALAQAYRPVRIAVIDDASNDETPSLRQFYPSVSWERWDEAHGYLCARNYMMLNAAEDYYVSLDDDSWFLNSDELALAVGFLECNPKVAAVAFDILSPDQPTPRPRRPACPTAMFIGCGHVLRLTAVKELGGYDEFPGYYGSEEKDLCLRLIDAGYEIVTMDGLHVWHDKTMRARDLQLQHRSGVCNDLVFELRRCPLGLLVPILGWKIVRHVCFAIKNGLLRACILGIGKFICVFGAVARSRKPVRLSAYSRYRSLLRVSQAMPLSSGTS